VRWITLLLRFLDPLVRFAHGHHRGGAVPRRQFVDEDAGFHRGIEDDELLRLFDCRDVEDVEAAPRPIVLSERACDGELALVRQPSDVREVAGEDRVTLFPFDFRILRTSLQDAEDVHLHPAFIGAELLRQLRVVICGCEGRDGEDGEGDPRST
jgi:hypothetical protein